MGNASPYIEPDDRYQRRPQKQPQEARPPDIVPKNTFETMAGKLLLFLVLLLMCLGVLAVYSSGAGWGAQKFSNSEYFLWRQAFYTLLGISVIFLVGGLDYKILKRLSKIILFVSIFLLGLLIVLKAAGLVDGAARWIGIGRFRFQASDMAKYAIIIHMSYLISEKQSYIKDLHRAYYPMITVLMMVVALVAIEPNFSTASVLAVIGFIMMFAGRVSLFHLTVTGLAILPVAGVFAVAAPYRMARLLTFIGEGDENMSYQIRQALIGFGNGGLFGLGPGESKQRELFLPAPYNDFIFAVIGEEYGFVGAVLILLLFVGIVICGFSIAKNAMDEFGRHLAFGITIAIGLYAFINAGVACHVLPTTGLPMPFISFGGSAALFNSFGIGVLISISREKKRKQKARTGKEKKQAGKSTAFGVYTES